MLQDDFKGSYTTIPYAFYFQREEDYEMNLISHHHKEPELIAMISGQADFYIDTVCHKLSAGDVLIIPPYCMHRAIIAPHTSYDCVCFDLSLFWDKQLCEGLDSGELTVSGHLSNQFEHTQRLNKCIRDTVKARRQDKIGWEMEVIGNLSLLFGILNQNGFFIRSGRPVPQHKFAKDTYKYVKENYFEGITSRTAAKALHINNSYFCRRFKKTFGCCFAEYLIEFRLENAKSLLKDSVMSISDIAVKTGFCSFSYFSKVFKESTGITPSQYRKQNRR